MKRLALVLSILLALSAALPAGLAWSASLGDIEAPLTVDEFDVAASLDEIQSP